MTDCEIAWLAGLFDGEGCIKWSGRNGVLLAISMSDPDILHKVKEITGVGQVYELSDRSLKAGHKPMYEWNIGKKQDVEYLLSSMVFWFGERRKLRAKEALKRLQNNKGINLPVRHGTVSGYFRERKLGLETCSDCKTAQTEKSKYYAARLKGK